MDNLFYKRKLNDVIIKCPIEAGVEILVYNLLDETITDLEKYALVDINSICKKTGGNLSTEGGISDIAIVSTNFNFKNQTNGNIYGFVEVKNTSVKLTTTDQIKKQMEKVNHFIYTNGLVWKYYCNQKEEWTINLSTKKELPSKAKIPIDIDIDCFNELKKKLNNIEWDT